MMESLFYWGLMVEIEFWALFLEEKLLHKYNENGITCVKNVIEYV